MTPHSASQMRTRPTKPAPAHPAGAGADLTHLLLDPPNRVTPNQFRVLQALLYTNQALTLSDLSAATRANSTTQYARAVTVLLSYHFIEEVPTQPAGTNLADLTVRLTTNGRDATEALVTAARKLAAFKPM